MNRLLAFRHDGGIDLLTSNVSPKISKLFLQFDHIPLFSTSNGKQVQILHWTLRFVSVI